MIIAEYTLDHPILRRTLNRVPGAKLAWEDSFMDSDGRLRDIAWMECDDFEALDAVLSDDPTVANPTVLTETGGRRLYRYDLAGDGTESSIMPVVVEVGGVHQEVTASDEGWRNRTRYPDREAFQRVYRFCREKDVDFAFHRLYEESPMAGTEGHGLSDLQRETLVEAVNCGYLDVPRRSSLEELADRLGIAESSASERFRRGVRNLIERTLAP